jgi:Glyoxalase-like domain
MLGSDREDPYGKRAGQGWLYVAVEDPDAHCRRARAAGAEVMTELHDTDYGSRDYTARDPEGNIWSFDAVWEIVQVILRSWSRPPVTPPAQVTRRPRSRAGPGHAPAQDTRRPRSRAARQPGLETDRVSDRERLQVRLIRRGI